MDESIEPLLNANETHHSKSERKFRSKLSDTLKQPALYINIDDFKAKDSKNKKLDNKFIFKVYLHFLFQIILMLIIIIFYFKSKTLNNIFNNNKTLFYIIAIITFITYIFPLMSDEILKKAPYNYIYLLIFSVCLSYILCIIFQSVNVKLIRVGAILFIIEILYLTIDSYFSKKNNDDITNTSIFMGLSLLFIGSILYFIDKVYFLKIFLLILIILLFGIYLLYDMNLIFLEKRRKFEENQYVLATMFLYIDIIQTIFELIGKFYDSCENETPKIPHNKNTHTKNTIFTGDKAYRKKYIQNSEEDKEDPVNIKRTYSDKVLKSDIIIKESENENEESESEKEHNQSFKHTTEKKLSFENKEEDDILNN